MAHAGAAGLAGSDLVATAAPDGLAATAGSAASAGTRAGLATAPGPGSRTWMGTTSGPAAHGGMAAVAGRAARANTCAGLAAAIGPRGRAIARVATTTGPACAGVHLAAAAGSAARPRTRTIWPSPPGHAAAPSPAWPPPPSQPPAPGTAPARPPPQPPTQPLPGPASIETHPDRQRCCLGWRTKASTNQTSINSGTICQRRHWFVLSTIQRPNELDRGGWATRSTLGPWRRGPEFAPPRHSRAG